MATILQVEQLTKSFGDLILFENLSFGVSEGEKIGLIASNGSGKTTLLNILAGRESYDSGNIVFRNGVRVSYLPQEPFFSDGLTVLEACFSSSNETARLIARYEAALSANDMGHLENILSEMDHFKAWDYELRIKQILSQLKIVDFDQPIAELSGGQLKRVALANALISEPDLFILDEPTNHLDLEMVEWLETYLSRSTMSVLMVTHDRYFLDRVCNQILEIDQRQLYRYNGSYNYYLEKRDERLNSQNAEADKAANLLRKELDWMRRQPQARGHKAKYRIDAFYELEKKSKQQRSQDQISLDIKASYIGSKIFEAKDVSKRFGDLVILDNFNYTFSRYEKMGIVGNNGAGKSTFIKLLLGIEKPDGGHFDVGETVRFGYYSQEGLAFDENKKVIDVVSEIAEVIHFDDNNRLTASQLLTHFLFPPSKQHSFVYKLSGGEKRRLYLCTVLMRNPNFLVLDEPTNDLDIVTLNVLEEYLQNFKGCLIVVSHDRYFMDKMVDHLLVFEGNGVLKDFPGNYTLYRAWKEQEEEERKSRNPEPKKENALKKEIPVKDKRRLSYKEQREYEVLDKEIPRLEAEKALLEEELSSGNLSSDELLAKSQRISIIIDELDEKSMRWLELGELI
ncbi:MAG: ABC-F family ATP-binding cassette domain-containing protein [Bacteroidales bacterium]|nr:ABC-F family ATP-binding cassette domain-containing protein [Bacteroidales bacterium]